MFCVTVPVRQAWICTPVTGWDDWVLAGRWDDGTCV